MTSYCPHCKKFYQMVLRPYELRNEIDLIKVNVELKQGLRRIKEDDSYFYKEQETTYHQEYMWAGNIVPGGHAVPCITIIPPYKNSKNITEEDIIFSEGDEAEYFRKVRRELDKYILRRAHVVI